MGVLHGERRPVFGLRRVVFYAFFCYFVGKILQNHERMKQKTHYSEALAYLRDYCLHHGRAMHFSHGDIFEAEGAAASRFGYIESGSFHNLVRIYEGDESTVRPSLRATLWAAFPTVSMAMPLPSPPVPISPIPSMSSMAQTSMSTTARARRRSGWAANTWPTA